MGKISKGTKCSIKGCKNEALRSLDVGKVKQAGLDTEGARRAYLCKDHYKEFKKGNKKNAQIERWRFTG